MFSDPSHARLACTSDLMHVSISMPSEPCSYAHLRMHVSTSMAKAQLPSHNEHQSQSTRHIAPSAVPMCICMKACARSLPLMSPPKAFPLPSGCEPPSHSSPKSLSTSLFLAMLRFCNLSYSGVDAAGDGGGGGVAGGACKHTLLRSARRS